MTTKILVRVILGLQVLQILDRIIEIQIDRYKDKERSIERMDNLEDQIFKLNNK